MAFAGDMAKYGYDVTVFEALHEIGGVLKYGIPEFRLPNKIVDVEIDNLGKMGVNFIKDCIVGKTIGVEDLKAEAFQRNIRGFRCRTTKLYEYPGRELYQYHVFK